MSAITSIYDQIATWTPTYDSDVTIPVKNYDEITNTFKDANAPYRMLLFGPSPAQADEGSFIALGKLEKVVWTIHDYLYLKPTGLGLGYAEIGGKLMEYAASYLEQARQNRAPTTQSHVVGIECIPGTLYWPPGDVTGDQYFGMDCVLSIEEFVSGA